MASFRDWLNARPQIKDKYLALTDAQKAKYKAAWQEGGASAAKEVMTSFSTTKTTFQDWLAKHDTIRENYMKLTPEQKAEYRNAWNSGGADAAKEIMQKFRAEGGGTVGGDEAEERTHESFLKWLEEHPSIANSYQELNDTDKATYEDIWIKQGTDKAKQFLHNSLLIVDPDEATTEIADGVHVPTFTKYPTPSLLYDEEGEGPPTIESSYDFVGGIKTSRADTVGGVDMPGFNVTGPIQGSALQRTGNVNMPGYQGAEGINQYTADASTYEMVDPMSFASQYGEAYRDEVLKNASLADQIALQQLETELGGLTDYARAAAALKRQETSIDNAFNQAQRIRQVQQAVPDVVEDLAGQRDRATAYAEGRLPDTIDDRMMELNVRSRAADQAGASGFGSMSMAGQKASDLMSAEQRMQLSQYGDQLLTQNMGARTELMLAPTEYISAGQQISVMPSQSASVLAASSLGQLNELANISATTALGTQVNQEQFAANMANDISQFNAAIQQDTEKFNSTMAEQQAQFQANMQTQIDTFNRQMEQAENLTQAEIDQRTKEFNANMAVQQESFQAQMQESISTFNAQLAVNQNQFNAQLSQRTNEFNANLATTQNQFWSTLNQRTSEFNATMDYNTEVANTGIENAFALGRFDYAVTYKGMIAGALNKMEDTKLQLELAEKELKIYQEALLAQLDLEREKLEAIRAELDKEEEEPPEEEEEE